MSPCNYFWSRYLIWSIRICCYFTNFYLFVSLVDSFSSLLSLSNYSVQAAVLVYSIVCVEVISRLVGRYYKPDFISESEAAAVTYPGRPVLGREQFLYRRNAELVIYESVGFFALNIPLAIGLNRFSNHSQTADMLFGAFLGIGAAILCFVGVVMMVVVDMNHRTNTGILFMRGMGLFLLIPPVIFVIHALQVFFYL